eukprot:gnl/MRDRNA2_/MRDRNA2_2227_c0_seq1.p1 gnl/MRDRNA2_/MRDRNA2_2227_c0~~gnl/MRDRNA2_/MRDRNA2_2227_c0_seq1.p1  ORF type:complete len:108 (-),score=10.53 gnl/MRDRNA2_/MRDRNA2_2227_c0_seq1:26-349(-)
MATLLKYIHSNVYLLRLDCDQIHQERNKSVSQLRPPKSAREDTAGAWPGKKEKRVPAQLIESTSGLISSSRNLWNRGIGTRTLSSQAAAWTRKPRYAKPKASDMTQK